MILIARAIANKKNYFIFTCGCVRAKKIKIRANFHSNELMISYKYVGNMFFSRKSNIAPNDYMIKLINDSNEFQSIHRFTITTLFCMKHWKKNWWNAYTLESEKVQRKLKNKNNPLDERKKFISLLLHTHTISFIKKEFFWSWYARTLFLLIFGIHERFLIPYRSNFGKQTFNSWMYTICEWLCVS